jgi:hypothetical protein
MMEDTVRLRGAIAALALLPLAASGCMSMLASDGGDSRCATAGVQVLTAPPGATARTARGDHITTPGVLRLDCRTDHVIEIVCPGHRPQVVVVRSEQSGARWVASFVLNFLAWGWWTGGVGMVVGVVVDAVHGSLKELSPDTIFVELEPEPPRRVSGVSATAAVGPPEPDRLPTSR